MQWSLKFRLKGLLSPTKEKGFSKKNDSECQHKKNFLKQEYLCSEITHMHACIYLYEMFYLEGSRGNYLGIEDTFIVLRI